MQRIDILTGTLGKALGGASGGYTSGRREFIDMLRQRSRPYLFSNSVAPPIVSASIKAIDLLMESTELRDKLERNTRFFRQEITKVGYDVLPGEHPIVPIMLYDAALASRTADAMLAKGVYVIGFSYPVVPQGRAHPHADLGRAFPTGSGVRPGEVCRSPPGTGLTIRYHPDRPEYPDAERTTRPRLFAGMDGRAAESPRCSECTACLSNTESARSRRRHRSRLPTAALVHLCQDACAQCDRSQ